MCTMPSLLRPPRCTVHTQVEYAERNKEGGDKRFFLDMLVAKEFAQVKRSVFVHCIEMHI